MRDPNRIKKFCNELAEIWISQCPDWRFGQLMCNVLGSDGVDPFFKEEPQMLKLFKAYFQIDEEKA